jgi:hypothetical protein
MHHPQFWTAFVYTMLYTTISALVILSIFLGVILMAMEESSEDMDLWKRTNRKIHRDVTARPFLKEYINVLLTVFQTMDTSADGALQVRDSDDCGVECSGLWCGLWCRM